MEVESIWDLGVDDLTKVEGREEKEKKPVDVMEVIRVTLQGLRAVRSLALAIPTSSLPGGSSHPSTTNKSTGIPGLSHVSGIRRSSGGNNNGPGNRQSISTPSRPAGRVASVGAFPVASLTGNQIAAASAAAAAAAGGGSKDDAMNGRPDPMAELRKSALGVLTSLKAMEEKCRISGSNQTEREQTSQSELEASPLVLPRTTTPDGIEIESVTSSNSLPTKETELPPAITSRRASFTNSIANLNASHHSNPPSIPRSSPLLSPEDDRDEAFFFAEREGLEEEQRKTWYERLTSGEDGWVYREDIRVSPDLEMERNVVIGWVDSVEKVIYTGVASTTCGRKDGVVVERQRERAWVTGMTSRRNSAGRRDSQNLADRQVGLGEMQEGDEEAVEEDLPTWAVETLWEGKSLREFDGVRLAC